MTRRTALLVVLAMGMAGCASMRKIDVTSEPGSSYTVDVYNSHSTTLTVSYTDTRGTHNLGTVAAGSTQRFVIAGSSSATVTVTGRTSGGASYPKTVTLTGGTTKITL